MLDEFPALGRLDFFETALAFMAGYGIRAFLIAQSLNQIEKAYGEHNSILDNCHVRVAFATNDERTAKRISDALGTTTEQRAMRNYAGHRLAPWLAHVMVSRQETSRPLLTPGEVMQLPPSDSLVLVSGMPPIRAKKLRYFEDARFNARVRPAPALGGDAFADCPPERSHDWAGCRAAPLPPAAEPGVEEEGRASEGGQRLERHPGLAGGEPRPVVRRALDPLGPGVDEEDGLGASAPLPDGMGLAPAVAADGINQGSGRGRDLIPSF
jgi:type IV secretion system protein VirD4